MTGWKPTFTRAEQVEPGMLLRRADQAVIVVDARFEGDDVVVLTRKVLPDDVRQETRYRRDRLVQVVGRVSRTTRGGA
jgi:hypothetical protein